MARKAEIRLADGTLVEGELVEVMDEEQVIIPPDELQPAQSEHAEPLHDDQEHAAPRPVGTPDTRDSLAAEETQARAAHQVSLMTASVMRSDPDRAAMQRFVDQADARLNATLADIRTRRSQLHL